MHAFIQERWIDSLKKSKRSSSWMDMSERETERKKEKLSCM
jgi:hypothetical protein